MRLSLRQVQTEVHGLEQQEELGLAVRVVSKSKGKGHKHKSTRAENHSVLEVKLQIVTKLQDQRLQVDQCGTVRFRQFGSLHVNQQTRCRNKDEIGNREHNDEEALTPTVFVFRRNQEVREAHMDSPEEREGQESESAPK